ncbi:2,3,4,5-tetrahydropyridine-2,6-dicarboxylate N-succinyltransferase [Myxococcus landrumensis]|uniref:2,3,4,5-tetrahydropyridine-2,6-dicarboxylate N-succinyltransferase n=1 Tax=Myxococcus landrumensis TaxID=2813577 RepID=A0ABX7N4L8_9BACT|nr:2,3,4,5-tetrahydropyridine-2,6-dicarboxylate N-succinyltransferase [Myxococcus landrumus]QSQ12637.1 2,3,4,5-tetrahydropyridine-2,6-dicarboxylate N-succinyltransferase [Myxococcus landrumus]
MLPIEELSQKVSAAFADRTKLKDPDFVSAVRETVARLDSGELRVAEKGPDGWKVHAWVKEAILLFFAVSEMKVMEVGPFEFHDKVPLKKGLDKAGVRVVPPGTVRYGAFVERGAVVMPGYVNIGARVGSGTMVDTWATVGSCAQVGSDVHLSGGVGLGGVLEPPTASPVIIEDRAFLGSRCIVVEGVVVEEEAVLGANVVLTASTQIIDVTGPEERVYKGRVPARSVVIPGMREKQFPAGKYMVPCALIIGQRTQSTDKKTSLNSALRDFAVPV